MARNIPNPPPSKGALGYYVKYLGADTNFAGYGTVSTGDEMFIPADVWVDSDRTLFRVQGWGPVDYDPTADATPGTVSAVATLADAATISWSEGALAKVTLAGNRTLAKPTHDLATGDGMTLLLQVTQGAGGSHTLAYASGIEFPGGTAPTLSTDAGAVDILTFVTFDGGTTWRAAIQQDFA